MGHETRLLSSALSKLRVDTADNVVSIYTGGGGVIIAFETLISYLSILSAAVANLVVHSVIPGLHRHELQNLVRESRFSH